MATQIMVSVFPQFSICERVKALVNQFREIWWECSTEFPALGRAYTPHEQRLREALFHRYLALLKSESKLTTKGSDKDESRRRIIEATEEFACSALDLNDRQIQAIRSYGFFEVAAQFAQQARRFDPALTDDDIFQASRNVWSMNLMQLLLGQPVRLSPSILAYSLLYPYTDNYIDDPSIPAQTKISFNQRFRKRLIGDYILPANDHERNISTLIGIIEEEFDRGRAPQVYESLLAIHTAQSKSLRLLKRNTSPYEVDVLGLCFEKGGTSVLADGYLVGSDLTPAQEEFMFNFGTFTQLFDDLEDVQVDLGKGLMTIYSQTATRWPLDAITNRTFHFGDRVMEAFNRFTNPNLSPLMDIMRQYMPVLLVAEAGLAGRYYTSDYLRELEPHCPFRFSFLREQRRKLSRQGISPIQLVEVLAG